jgi:hypothetical protein
MVFEKKGFTNTLEMIYSKSFKTFKAEKNVYFGKIWLFMEK